MVIAHSLQLHVQLYVRGVCVCVCVCVSVCGCVCVCVLLWSANLSNKFNRFITFFSHLYQCLLWSANLLPIYDALIASKHASKLWKMWSHAECKVFPSSPPQLRFFCFCFFAFKTTVGKVFGHLCMPLGMPRITKGSISREPLCRFLSFFQGK